MPAPLQLSLSDAERDTLAAIRDTDPQPYRRERAAALLKVAGNASARAVALHGLLRPRQPDTLYAWVHRYDAEGLASLAIRPGRGRKPAFSPSASHSGRRARGTAAPRAPRSSRVR